MQISWALIVLPLSVLPVVRFSSLLCLPCSPLPLFSASCPLSLSLRCFSLFSPSLSPMVPMATMLLALKSMPTYKKADLVGCYYQAHWNKLFLLLSPLFLPCFCGSWFSVLPLCLPLPLPPFVPLFASLLPLLLPLRRSLPSSPVCLPLSGPWAPLWTFPLLACNHSRAGCMDCSTD